MSQLFNRIGFLVVEGQKFNTRIQFDVEKNLETSANKSKVTVYNLNQTSRTFVSEPGKLMWIEAGYVGNTSIIFTGRIAENGVTIAKNGADIVTAIESGDGETELQTPIQISMGNNASVLQVIEASTKITGLATGVIEGIKNRKFEKGFCFSGTFKELLELVKKDSDAEASVQDGALQIIAQAADTGEDAVLLTPQTGMIGVPTKEKKNFKVTSLLNPRIQPGRLVKVESQFANIDGFFKVTKVVHNGDTHEGPWTSSIEGVELG